MRWSWNQPNCQWTLLTNGLNVIRPGRLTNRLLSKHYDNLRCSSHSAKRTEECSWCFVWGGKIPNPWKWTREKRIFLFWSFNLIPHAATENLTRRRSTLSGNKIRVSPHLKRIISTSPLWSHPDVWFCHPDDAKRSDWNSIERLF
jgi:hypothetical protein